MNLHASPLERIEHPGFFDAEDVQLERAIDDAVEDGDAMLRYTPGDLLRALAEVCDDAGRQDAARELLRPLYAATAGLLMREFHAESKDHPAVRDVAHLALMLESERRR